MPTEDEVDRAAEKCAKAARKSGSPRNRRDWLIVVGVLINNSDEMLEAVLRHARMLNVTWLTRVVDILLSNIAAGNTYRDPEGSLRLRRESAELRAIITE